MLLAVGGWRLPAQNLAEFEKRVTEFTLANGLHFIVVERHESPVVSFETFVNAGSADDPGGEAGMAHLLARMAFKGTESIGTQDWPAEKRALDAVEEAADRLDAERAKGSRADAARLAGFAAELNMAIGRAQSYAAPNRFLGILQENGGVDISATVVHDYSEFHYSLPSNRMELWFLMESQRLLRPAMREFYTEREAAIADYRTNVENNTQGKLVQNLLPTAFTASPYRNPGVGWRSDLASLRSSRAKAFLEKYFVSGNMTMTMVGDVNPADARRLAEHYFGVLGARPAPAAPHAADPPQQGPKTVVLYAPQSMLVAGYKRPDMYDRDDAVFDVMRLILCNGRTGLLYKQLVEERHIAQTVQMDTPFPGGRLPGLTVFYLTAAPGHSASELETALTQALTSLQAQPVDARVLAQARAQTRVLLLRQLASNAGLAFLLAAYHAEYGNWRKLFTSLDDWSKVTAADVQRVARRYFVADGRTLAIAEPRPGAVR